MITYSRLGKCGRLGNQLWQIASTMGIAEKMGQSGGFYQWDYRPFFTIPSEFFPENYLHRDRGLIQAHETSYVNHIDHRAREYLQDMWLWSDIEDQVHDWFKPTDFALDAIAEHNWFFELDRPILSMHVRLGDNLEQPNRCHPIRPLSYYREALERMEDEKFGSLVVFSDNPEWCKDKFQGVLVDHYFEGIPRAKEHLPEYRHGPIKDWLDLHMMAMCDLHIIGNSTYAWWGAFLSANRRAIYPTPWFGPELSYINAELMFDHRWTPISHPQMA